MDILESKEVLLEKSFSWWKKLNKKIEGKPQPVQVLQKRTMNTAIATLEDLINVPFSELSMSLYFYCQDLQMTQFTKLYESQVELAGANPEKFVFQLHSFFNEISTKIKKENLYQDFFEFSYLCSRVRLSPNLYRSINSKVIMAYLNLLLQTTEYLRPSKFDFSKNIVGISTVGEVLTINDPFPLLDMGGYDLQLTTEKIFKTKAAVPNLPQLIHQSYSKYGYPLKSLEDIEMLSNVDRIFTAMTSTLYPFINEFTFDILPQKPYNTVATPLFDLTSGITFSLPTKLKKRKKTLPTNGVTIQFENLFFKTLLLKETYYHDRIFCLYKMQTTGGDISGFFDTKDAFFYSVFLDYDSKELNAHFQDLVLYCYSCYTLNDPNFEITKIGDFFIYKGTPITAMGTLQGGKLRNQYHKETDREVQAGARKGNDAYTSETKAIQGFIRKLPNGQKASEKAVALAESLGYDLSPSETYVQPFTKQVFKLKYKKTEE